MVATVELGGDTKTNCAIVGSVIGALVELEEIPRQWIGAVLGVEDKPFMQKRKKEFIPYDTFNFGQIDKLIGLGQCYYTYKKQKNYSVNGEYTF